MKIIGNLDWRHPLVRVRIKIASLLQNALALFGRWEAPTAEELACVQKDTVPVHGDRPDQQRLVYQTPRDAYVDVANLDYVPQGLASVNGRIITRYSIRRPSTAEILKSRRDGDKKLMTQGTVIEAETPYTYGDWVGDFVLSLVTCKDIVEPLCLPAFLATKPYVMRDIEALGIKYEVIDGPVCIQNARVLHKRIPSYYWGPQEVAAYRDAFKVTPPAARENTMTYLGRFDTLSEAAQRSYPSEAVARIVKSLGGEVFDAREASPQKFDDLAPQMETVIADQGSALFGVMHAQTKNVIELAEDDWWHSANLFIANGAGVKNYAVIHINNKSEDELRAQITAHLRDFGVID